MPVVIGLIARNLFLCVLMTGSVYADDVCTDTSTDPTCIEIRKRLALTAAIKAQTEAMTAEATAQVALNKARFEVPNSEAIKPRLGAAEVADQTTYPQKWLGAQATEFAVKLAAKKISKSIELALLTIPGSDFPAELAERKRMGEALTVLAAGVTAKLEEFNPIKSDNSAQTFKFGVGEFGAAIQGLASIAGFFVSDYKIYEGVNESLDELAQSTLLGELPNKVIRSNRILNPSKNLKIDDEISVVKAAIEKLFEKIIALRAATSGGNAATVALNKELLAKAEALHAEVLEALAKLFTTPAAGISAYARAVQVDIMLLQGSQSIEIKSELSGGILASKTRSFSSGSYKIVAMASVHYRLTSLTTGFSPAAGVTSAICYWELPVNEKNFDKSAVMCKESKIPN